MKESYGEGVAIYTGPESCGGYSNVMAEALTGVHAGQVLSREILFDFRWHGNEAIVAAAKAQMDKLVHCCSYVYHAKPVAAQKGEKLQEAYGNIVPKGVAIGEIRGKGLMLGIELVEDQASKAPAAAQAAKIRAAMRENGVLIGVGGGFGNVLRIQPPLTITEEELEKVVATLKTVMES
ncbi:hypothetical protein LCGC14_2949350 [marine sediment metagenome]|uniref:alanine--glyoxylate transaminase n=1 Tax=marine sediment metagenome TaxID=412755 RepID=A0A0F9A6Y0_9ZZZZ